MIIILTTFFLAKLLNDRISNYYISVWALSSYDSSGYASTLFAFVFFPLRVIHRKPWHACFHYFEKRLKGLIQRRSLLQKNINAELYVFSSIPRYFSIDLRLCSNVYSAQKEIIIYGRKFLFTLCKLFGRCNFLEQHQNLRS